MSLLRLTPRVQHYAWGDAEFIPRFIGQVNSEDQPFAELWFGTHPDLPSLVDGAPLDTVLEGELPYLMKVLSAARPLSVQAHPTAQQAREGFARENAAGIPLSAPQRNYRDPRPKPELIVALTDFYALVGFRPLSEIASLLREVPELSRLDPEFEPTTARLRRLYEKVRKRRIHLGTRETWKHLFPQDRGGRYLLSPGLIETVRMYTEGLGKVTGTEALWPGWGY